MDGRKAVKTGEFAIAGGKFEVMVAPTARLRATGPGYTPEMKSIFMDYPPLLNGMLNMTPEQLSDWGTFEGIRRTLGSVRIDFRLQGEPTDDRAFSFNMGQTFCRDIAPKLPSGAASGTG